LDIILAKRKAFLEAYTFGKTSPNKRIKKVIRMISKRKRTGTAKKYRLRLKRKDPNKVSANEVKSSTIKIFIKLLVISMVANNFRGFFSKLTTTFSSLPLLESSFILVWFREKKAISEPEIKAELISNKIKTMAFTAIIASKEVSRENKGSGSGSKV
jgi:hypothetical protein